MVRADPSLELLASGYQAVEAPCIDTEGNLYFSDTVGGGVYLLRPDGGVATVVPKRKGAGGIVLHAAGGIVMSGRDLTHVLDGDSRLVLSRDDVPAVLGTRVGGFNDITADRDGRVFAGTTRFTDDGEQVPGELLMITAPGAVAVVYGDVGMTNGIAQSADGARLYHADTAGRRIIVSSMDVDGVPMPIGELTTELPGRPDGVAADLDGGLWVAWGGSVVRFDRRGAVERELRMPSNHVLNCCFGGEDRMVLYVTTMDTTGNPELGGCIYRTRVDTPGSDVPVARV